MNNRYMRYYKNFKRPPFAPTYRPTEEEFIDPIEYVKKIRPEAEKYGIVKIKPPKSFRPPFAIKSESFVFTPRIQRLNEIDGLLRLRLLFEIEISTFWELQGCELKTPIIDNKFVDLYRLSRFVAEKGGGDALTEQRRWSQVGKQLGLNSHQCPRLREIYYKWVAPFEKCLEEIEKESEKEPEADCSQTIEGRHRSLEPKSRMMAGYRHPTKERKTRTDSVDDVVCEKCRRGDDEDRLLLCDECNAALHTYCCDPPLAEVPETEWRCYRCIKAKVKSIGENFGFHDAHQEYNLVTFAEYANTWKRDYFQKNIFDTTQEEVEKEFWRKVADMSGDISVKYGADLLASKVGSGFPVIFGEQKRKKGDEIRKLYAEHPWNLNNMPVLKGSVLSHIDSGISGMMVPWVYIGMCFTTFCWHTEDHWTYSINYLHWGERKIWYGVSGLEGEKFDKVLNNIVPDLFRKHPDLLHHLTTMINPMILMEHGISVYTIHQEPGEFIITFPRAYHSGYNEGLNCAEAVNFAPPDWLRLGRLCIADYAHVHRRCVFSHDELVIRMVDKIVNLDLSMKVALYDELEKIVSKEKKWLSRFPKSKHRYERTKFERIQDDQRECVFCKTTLYLSALECKHAKLSCLKHAEHLCDKCLVEDYYVKYRHTMDELLSMRGEVGKAVEQYVKWKDKADNLLHLPDDSKPKLEDLHELVRLADIQQIPSCETLVKLNRTIKECESVYNVVNSLLFPKTAISFNAKKTDYDGVMRLKTKVEKLTCCLPEKLLGFYAFVERLSNWKKRVRCLIGTSIGEDINYEVAVDEAKQLVDEAENFDVVLPETGDVKQLLNVYQWLSLASKLLHWRYSCENVKSEIINDDSLTLEEVKGLQKWKLKAVEKLIDEGMSLMEENKEIQRMVDEVHSCMKLGWNKEFAAEKVLLDESNEGSGIGRANKIWNDFKVCNWLSMQKLDELRTEIVKARNIYKLYTEGREKSDITFTDLKTYEGLCAQSFFMNQSEIHKEITEARNALRRFMEEIRRMFASSSTTYTLYDILCGRQDLEMLIKGDTPSCDHFLIRSLTDDWGKLEDFSSSSELENHLRDLDDSFCASMVALREMNMKRGVHETCACAFSKTDEHVYLTCCLCFSKTHASCARWNDFLLNLPSGYYMCICCLRGRRPTFDEVKDVCNSAPPSLERTLVRFVLERCLEAYKEANSVITLIDRETKDDSSILYRFESSIMRLLSSVIIDPKALKNTTTKLPLAQHLNETEFLALERLRISSNCAEKEIFPSSPSVSKRAHSEESEVISEIKRKRMNNSEVDFITKPKISTV